MPPTCMHEHMGALQHIITAIRRRGTLLHLLPFALELGFLAILGLPQHLDQGLEHLHRPIISRQPPRGLDGFQLQGTVAGRGR